MNILIDELPESVEIEGIEYEINTDFRISMLFELMMQDPDITDEEKVENALELYFPQIPPVEYISETIDVIMDFYSCGKDKLVSNGKSNSKGKAKQIYSFESDADYIYAAFLDQYRIDLQDIEYLHWWKFKALFNALKEDNEIVKIMGYRSINITNDMSKHEKEFYKKMKELYKLPDNISKNEKEKINQIEDILMNGGDLESIL